MGSDGDYILRRWRFFGAAVGGGGGGLASARRKEGRMGERQSTFQRNRRLHRQDM